MPLSDLTARERAIIYRCLRVAADESCVYPDWEFSTLFGPRRPEFVALVDQWPNLDENSDEVRFAINNALNNILGYPHEWQDDWESHFDFSKRDVWEVFLKWRGRPIKNYFDGAM